MKHSVLVRKDEGEALQEMQSPCKKAPDGKHNVESYGGRVYRMMECLHCSIAVLFTPV